MSTYVTLVQVRNRYEQDIPTGQAAYVESVIDEAETVLLARVPTLPALITAGATSVAIVRTVIIRAVLRVLRNPNGYRSEQAGDYSYQFDAASSGQVDYTPAEIFLITGNTRNIVVPRTIGMRPPSPFQVDQ